MSRRISILSPSNQLTQSNSFKTGLVMTWNEVSSQNEPKLTILGDMLPFLFFGTKSNQTVSIYTYIMRKSKPHHNLTIYIVWHTKVSLRKNQNNKQINFLVWVSSTKQSLNKFWPFWQKGGGSGDFLVALTQLFFVKQFWTSLSWKYKQTTNFIFQPKSQCGP